MDVFREVALHMTKLADNAVLLLDSEGVRLGADTRITSVHCQRARTARAAQGGSAGRFADGVVGSGTLLCEL